jgi:hypothetical protein
MERKFFRRTSNNSLIDEKSKRSLTIINISIGKLVIENDLFRQRCLSQVEEGKQRFENDLEKARKTFFSKEDMANWLCKMQEDVETETDLIYIQFEAKLGGDPNKIDFEKVGYLAGIYSEAETYLKILTASEPVCRNKARFEVYDKLEKLDSDYLRIDNLPGYYQIHKAKLIKKHEFEIKSLDEYWQDYLSLKEKHNVAEGFGDKKYLLYMYHREFSMELHKIRPRGDIKLMLDYHYIKFKGVPTDFLNNIEYRILPILEEYAVSDYIVYRQLILEWVKEKNEIMSFEDQNFLIEAIEDCCATFINSLAIHRSLNDENKYNTIIKDLLQKVIGSKRWTASDQTLGGFTDSSSLASSAGIAERDLIIYNEKQQIVSAAEFFRLNHVPANIDADSIPKSHLLKIFRNEVTGISPLFMIVYCETKSFNETWEKYLSFIQKIDFGTYPLINLQSGLSTVNRANIKKAISEHNRESMVIQLYHIFINMYP